MKMIRCRGCGKEISSVMEQCPYCGMQTMFGKNRKKDEVMGKAIMIDAITGAIGLIAVIVGLCIMSNDRNQIFSGYNYSFPWSAHEIFVLALIMFGITQIVSCIMRILKKINESNNKPNL